MWRAQCWRAKDERHSSPCWCSLCPWEVRWQLSRYGDHLFWILIIVYFFFLPDLSTTRLPLLPSLPAFALSPAPSCCEHLPVILFPYSVLRICLNLLPGRPFPFQVSPATSLGGIVRLLPRLRMEALDAGSPVLLAVFLARVPALHIPASLPSHFYFWVYSDRGCVCWVCCEMNSSLPLVTGSLILLSPCVVFSCFFF